MICDFAGTEVFERGRVLWAKVGPRYATMLWLVGFCRCQASWFTVRNLSLRVQMLGIVWHGRNEGNFCVKEMEFWCSIWFDCIWFNNVQIHIDMIQHLDLDGKLMKTDENSSSCEILPVVCPIQLMYLSGSFWSKIHSGLYKSHGLWKSSAWMGNGYQWLSMDKMGDGWR